MNKLQLSIYPIIFLFFILFMTFCHKEEPKSVSESPKPISFHIKDTKHGQPMADVEIALLKKNIAYISVYDYVSTLGTTDANGNLTWNYNQDSLSQQYRFRVRKAGYYDTVITVPDSYQNDFEGALGQVAKVVFHLTYDNDTLPKGFVYYHGITEAPTEVPHYPGGYMKYPILILPFALHRPLLTHIDTTYTFDLKFSNAKQDFHCVLLDSTYIPTSSLNYPPIYPQKDLIVPAFTKDTTFLFEAFW